MDRLPKRPGERTVRGMDGDVDWVDDEPSAPLPGAGSGCAAEPDDVLDFGAHRSPPRWMERVSARVPHPRTLRWLSPVLAGALLAGYLVLTDAGGPGRHPGTDRSATPVVAADLADSTVLLIARQRGSLPDYVRPTAARGACAVAPAGSQPVQRITRRLRATLAGFTPRAVGRILDQSTALCAVQLRATDRAGTVVVVQVTAPQHRSPVEFTTLRIGVSTVGGATLCVATALTPAGWSVTVGSLGRPGDQPSSALLVGLAQDPLLLW